RQPKRLGLCGDNGSSIRRDGRLTQYNNVFLRHRVLHAPSRISRTVAERHTLVWDSAVKSVHMGEAEWLKETADRIISRQGYAFHLPIPHNVASMTAQTDERCEVCDRVL